MAVFGGSATLYGVLYEVLGAVGHLVNFSRQSKGTGGSFRIRFQPVGGGGDLRVEGQSKRIVEQWKSRTSKKSWGPVEIAREVLSDLLQDPSLDFPEDSTEYRFVTEGRVSDRTRARFEDLRCRLGDGWEVASLPDESREFFCSLESAATGCRPPGSSASSHRTKLRRLLRCFKIRDSQTLLELSRRIDAKLGPWLEYLDDLNDAKSRLCSLLWAKGASGEAEVNPSDLFREAGLVGIPLTEIDDLRASALTRLKRRIEKAGYERDADVRTCPLWPAEKPILLLGGDSGQGKSWQLARLALEMSSEAAVVFLPWDDHQESIPQRVANELWISAWKHDKPLALESLANRCQDVPLVACIDGVPSFAEARRLLDAFDWAESRVRLAFAGPSECRTLVEDSRQGGCYRRVEDFTVDELRRFLRARGRNWATVASDVLELLRRPLWARLFVEVGEEDWHPTQEYELFEQYWRHLRALPELRDYPEDFHSLLKLGLALLDPESAYPWTLGQLEKAGIRSDARSRLEKVGFWSRNEDRLTVWHDRLISWIVAEAIESQPDDQVLALFQKRTLRGQQPVDRLRGVFGYLAMDLLWLVLGKDRVGVAADLIATLERDASHYAVRTGVYEGSLLTLGARVVPALQLRLNQTAGTQERGIASAAARAIGRISASRAEGDPVRRVGRELLESDDVTRQDLGVEVVSLCPDPEAIQRLWEILSPLATEPKEDSNRNRIFWQARKLSGALKACLELAPARLLVEARRLAPGDGRWKTVAELLAKLENPESQNVWRELKTSLLAEVSEETVDSLVRCIEWYRDLEEADRLAEWAAAHPESNALWGLAWVDPDRALACFRVAPGAGSEGSAFRVLLERRLEVARKDLGFRLTEAKDEFWRIASLFRWSEDRIDLATLRLMIARLGHDLQEMKASPDELWREVGDGLKVLAQVHSPASLALLRTLAGSELDRELAELANLFLEDPFDRLETVWRVSLKIGGEAARLIVRAGLGSWANNDRALGWAMSSPAEFADALPATAWVSALLGRADDTIAHLLQGEENIDRTGSATLWLLLRNRPAMSDVVLQPVLERLSEPKDDDLVRCMAILGLSGRSDLLKGLPDWLRRAESLSPKEREAFDDMASLWVWRLGSDNPQTVRLLSEQISLSYFPGTAVALLRQSGTDDVQARLEEHLVAASRQGSFGRIELALTTELQKTRPVSEELVQAVRESHGEFRFARFPGSLDMVVLGASPEVIFKIARAASEVEIMDTRFDALKALWLYAPDLAFEKACQNLRSDGNGREQFVPLLLEWQPEAAVPILVEQAAVEAITEVRWAIGRVLRRAEPNRLEEVLRGRLRSKDYRVRASAADLSGWQPPGFLEAELEDLRDRDHRRTVQWATMKALARQRSERLVGELVTRFREGTALEKWSCLESILTVGDPFLLASREDSLWLGPIVGSEEGRFEVYANFRLKQRIKELASEAKRLDSA